jgi:hypothetical protein
MMRGTIAIMRREIFERRQLLWVAAAVSVMALAAPLIPGTAGHSAAAVWEVSGSWLALMAGGLLALGLGVSILGEDLSQGRLGFYFARPVSAAAVWAGKLLAGSLLIITSMLVILLPATLAADPSLIVEGAASWFVWTAYLGAPLLILLLAHAIGVMVRARSAWLLLDLGAAAAVSAVSWSALRPLFDLGAGLAILTLNGILAGGLIIGLGVASLCQVVVGRADLQRAHMALSVTLWTVLLTVSIAVLGSSVWLRQFTPDDLSRFWVESVSPDGRWVEVVGFGRHRLDVPQRFLASTVGAPPVRLELSRNRWMQWSEVVRYDASGRTAVVLEPARGDEPRRVYRLDLDQARPTPVPTTIVVGIHARCIVNPAGDLLVVEDDGLMSVHNLAEERQLIAFRVPRWLHASHTSFVDDNLLRGGRAVDADNGQRVYHLVEVRLSDGTVARTGSIPLQLMEARGRFSPVADVFVLEQWVGGEALDSVHHARTGELVRELDPEVDGRFIGFLDNGRIAGSLGDRQLVLASPDGDSRRVYDLGAHKWLTLGGEVAPGLLALAWTLPDTDQTRVELLDLSSGELRALTGDDLTGFIGWQFRKLAPHRLLLLRDSLVRWDPETGELVTVLGTRGS